MAKIVLDANVVIGWLDEYDSLGGRASKVVEDILAAGDSLLLLDFVVAEAISVVCRRASERKRNVPDLPAILEKVNRWYKRNEIEFVQRELGSNLTHVGAPFASSPVIARCDLRLSKGFTAVYGWHIPRLSVTHDAATSS
jgi:hypothetical protein